MECRPGCAACCEAISISSPLPGLPQGKPAGRVCPLLIAETRLCSLWATSDYPPVCRNFSAHPEHCGSTREEALGHLARLEALTRPDGKG